MQKNNASKTTTATKRQKYSIPLFIYYEENLKQVEARALEFFKHI